MPINIARFYRREQWKLECEIITPMFLGNSKQEAELRGAPFKGLLRYWWRVANGWRHSTPADLLKAENAIFGSPDDSGGKSQVLVEVNGEPSCFPENGFPKGKKIAHPEVKKKNGNPVPVDRFLYLGYGPIVREGTLKKEGKGAFCTGEKFVLLIAASHSSLKSIVNAVHCLQNFGAIGSRSRNGWGCFAVKSDDLQPIDDAALFREIGNPWEECFLRDYPHRLGLDGNKLLLWRGKTSHNDWQGVMNELAEIYLKLRLHHTFHGGGPHAQPQDRHVLGYPAGRNHSVKAWGNQGRHGSALRLIVRKDVDGKHRGYFLHLPHLFSSQMWPNGKSRQTEIWKQVHSTLDRFCDRVKLEEARP